MGHSFECDEFCDTKLALTLGSFANPVPKSTQKDRSLDLNLALGGSSGEHSRKKNGSNGDACEMNNGNKSDSSKKLRLSKEQSSVLKESFNQHSILNTEQKNNLAAQLNLLPRQVEIWFQNRRARTKLKMTETDCERWKKGYEEMAEENKKLKKELDHFHAMKKVKIDCSCGYICPNCRRGCPVTGSNDDCVAVVKPKAKQGGVKILG